MSIKNNYSSITPSLLLDFASSKSLDPSISFSRTTTGTYTDENGVLKTAPIGVPRFTHVPSTGESLGLLIEETRTNLRTNSEDITVWGNKVGATASGNTAYAPNGTLTADSLVENTDTRTWRWIEWSQSATSGTAYSVSCFVKTTGTMNFGVIYFFPDNSVFNGAVTTFNLITGTVASLGASTYSATITPYPNGWYRITATQNAAATSTGFFAVGFSESADIQTARTGTAGNTIGYVWGFQLEAATHATSYIPTTAGSTVTRTGDYATVLANPWFNNYYGTFIYEGVSPVYNNSNSWYWCMGSNDNRYGMFHNFGNDTFYPAYTIRTSAGTFTPTTTLSLNTKFKTGFAYNRLTSNQVAHLNGTLVSESTSAQGPNYEGGSPVVYLGRFLEESTSLVYPIDSTIAKFAYYPQRLTNSQLQALTR